MGSQMPLNPVVWFSSLNTGGPGDPGSSWGSCLNAATYSQRCCAEDNHSMSATHERWSHRGPALFAKYIEISWTPWIFLRFQGFFGSCWQLISHRFHQRDIRKMGCGSFLWDVRVSWATSVWCAFWIQFSPCQAVSQLVMAVVHCHRRGVAHRDGWPQGESMRIPSLRLILNTPVFFGFQRCVN